MKEKNHFEDLGVDGTSNEANIRFLQFCERAWKSVNPL